MIGSHNTFSYLPPKNFWGKITRLWNKCQDKTIQEQYDAGVRYFDIRIKLIDGFWHIVHNNVDYGSCYYPTLASMFNKLAPKDNVYIRIILDVRKIPKNKEEYKEKFLNYINMFNAYIVKPDNVHLDSAIVYWEWKELLKPSIEVKEYHASVSAKWYQYIFGTKKFAKLSNRYVRQTYYYYGEDNERVLLLDYV